MQVKVWATTRTQLRTWEVDVNRRVLRNLSRSGQVCKSHHLSDLTSIEKSASDDATLTLVFESANHPYTLTFTGDGVASSPTLRREVFYQLVCSLICQANAERLPPGAPLAVPG